MTKRQAKTPEIYYQRSLGELGFSPKPVKASVENCVASRRSEEYKRVLQLGDIAFDNPVERRKVERRRVAFRIRDKKGRAR